MAGKAAKDPFFKMKLALVRSVLSEPNPSVSTLEHAFVEEFGTPPSPQLITAFKNELQKRAKQPGRRRISLKFNLIREQVKAKREQDLEKEFKDKGGKYVEVALDAHLYQTLERMREVYGVANHSEVFALALKLLEQQAQRFAPEVFR